MLHASRVGRHHGGQTVLAEVSLSVDRSSRIGIVGPNGVGKSTLLRILAGEEQPDTGSVRRAPASTTVGMLPPAPDARPGETLREYLARRTGVTAAEQRLARATEALAASLPGADDEYSDALDEVLALGGADLDARAGAVCAEVGLPADRLDVEVGALSGGQAARAALAAILLSRFDVLLLDEPTNDLDFAGLDLLESFLARADAGLVVVSHDRAFLDPSVTQVVEIGEHTHRATLYAGGWSDYVAARALARQQQYEAHDTYVAERDRLRERQRTQRAWADKGVARVKRSGEPDKNIRHHRTQTSENQASKVKATERAIERLERVDKPWEGWQLHMTLSPSSRAATWWPASRARSSGAAASSWDRSTSSSAGRSGSLSWGPTAAASPRCSPPSSATCRSTRAGGGWGPASSSASSTSVASAPRAPVEATTSNPPPRCSTRSSPAPGSW